MNDRDVHQFDARSVGAIIERFMNNRQNKFALAGILVASEVYLSESETKELSKRIIEYAAMCGVIDQQSTMK